MPSQELHDTDSCDQCMQDGIDKCSVINDLKNPNPDWIERHNLTSEKVVESGEVKEEDETVEEVPPDVKITDFEVYSLGIVSASVCTSLSIEAATERMNKFHPTGIRSEWKLSKNKTFASGPPMPCQCPDHETHKHYLFNC